MEPEKGRNQLDNKFFELQSRYSQMDPLEAECELIAASLKESEQRYRILYDYNTSICLLLEQDGKIVSINHFGAENLGYEAEDLLGTNYCDLFATEDSSKVRHQIQSCVNESQNVLKPELQMVGKSEGSFWVKQVAKAVEDFEGNRRILMISEDITRFKRKESFLYGEVRVLDLISNGEYLKDVLESLCTMVEEQFQDVFCSVYLLNDSGSNFDLTASPSLSEKLSLKNRSIPTASYLQSLSTRDFNEDTKFAHLAISDFFVPEPDEALSITENASCLSTPILSRDSDLLGIVVTYFNNEAPITEFDLKILERAAYIAAIGIEREQSEKRLKKSFVQLSKTNRYESIINSVTQSVHKSLNLQDVMENALDSMSQNIEGAKNIAIYLVEGDEAVIKAYRGYSDRLIKAIHRIPFPKGYTWKTIIEGEPRYCADIDNDPDIVPSGIEVGTKSFVSMPIRNNEKTVGVININSLQSNMFDEDELKLLNIVANQIEVAIGNATHAEALQDAHSSLEKRVQQRTKELSQTVEMLEQEIGDRKRAEMQIKTSLDEKNVLLKEIHHRVKNNLQIICSLLSLQSCNITDPDALSMCKDSQHRIKSMALIHEHLCQSGNLALIDFSEYIKTLMDNLFDSFEESFNNIKAEVDVEGIKLGMDTAVPCGLIINELISNSIKHAFPPEHTKFNGGGFCGSILVKLAKLDDGGYKLTVSDDGVGFPEGLDYRKTDTLGLQLVCILASQLQGSVSLERKSGTRFNVVFYEN